MATEIDFEAPLTSVTIDVTALTKIIQHGRESLPQLVTGQLLGLDVNGELQITNCFPLPTTKQPEESSEQNAVPDGAHFQMNMLKMLKEVNIDSLPVGWYQSSLMGSFIHQNFIETQFNYQQKIQQCVCLVFDPVKISSGNLSLKALRLTDNFMSLYKEKKFTMASLAEKKLTHSDIFEELPIKVTQSALVDLLVSQIEQSTVAVNQMPTTAYLEKNMELLSECLDAQAQEQYKYNRYQQHVQRQQQHQQHQQYKRKMENQKRAQQGLDPLPEEEFGFVSNKLYQEPSRLETLMIQAQMEIYCQQIGSFSA